MYTVCTRLCVSSTPSPLDPSFCGPLPLQPCVSLGTQTLSPAVGLSRGHVTRWGHAELLGQQIHVHSRQNVSLPSCEAVNSSLFLASFPVVWSLSVCPSVESGQVEAKQRDEKQVWRERGGREGRDGGWEEQRNTALSGHLFLSWGHCFPQFPNIPISFSAT